MNSPGRNCIPILESGKYVCTYMSTSASTELFNHLGTHIFVFFFDFQLVLFTVNAQTVQCTKVFFPAMKHVIFFICSTQTVSDCGHIRLKQTNPRPLFFELQYTSKIYFILHCKLFVVKGFLTGNYLIIIYIKYQIKTIL